MDIASLFCWDAAGVARACVDRPTFMSALHNTPYNVTVMVVTDPVLYTPAIECDGCVVATTVAARFVSDMTATRGAGHVVDSVASLNLGEAVEVLLPCGAWTQTTVRLAMCVTPQDTLCARAVGGECTAWDLDTLFVDEQQTATPPSRPLKRRRRPVYAGYPPLTDARPRQRSRLGVLETMAADVNDTPGVMCTNYEDPVWWNLDEDATTVGHT